MRKIILTGLAIVASTTAFSEEAAFAKKGKFKFGPLQERTYEAGKDYTTITITDKVKSKNISSIGLNFGKGGAQNNPATKLRSTHSFEGLTLRSCVKTFQIEGKKLTVLAGKDYLKDAYGNSDITILGGKYKGQKAKVSAVKFKMSDFPAWNKKVPSLVLTIDKEFPNLEAMLLSKEQKEFYKKNGIKKPYSAGILIENMNLQHIGKLKGGWWGQNLSIQQENRPGGTGKLSGLFVPKKGEKGKKGQSILRMGGSKSNVDKGDSVVKLWARAFEGSPTLTISWGKGLDEIIPITKEWKQYTVQKSLTGKTGFTVAVIVSGDGKALIDEIEVFVGGDTNPTAFRDEYVAMLKQLNVGIFRVLQMGGNTMENFLRPRVEQSCYLSSPWHMANVISGRAGGEDGPYGFHEVLGLCEYLGIDPWYNIPGTLHEDEIPLLMEYLGGPAGTKGGDIRIKLGHEKPWTETLSQINIEYGNEQWNNFGPFQWGGYGGPGYWSGLTKVAKASKYYKENMIFHAGSQNWSTRQAASHAKYNSNMDRVAVAPYIWHSYSKLEDDATKLEGRDLFKLCYAKSLDVIANLMGKVDKVLRDGGIKGMSVYEFNYHMTDGSGPLFNRYRTYYSLGGALNIANSILYMQKEFNAKEQCLFNFNQETYENKKAWPGWGITLFDKDTKTRRYRSTALAMDLMNRAILKGGDSVQTLYNGENPTFDAIGKFNAIHTGKGKLSKMTNIPLLWTYAFKKENQKSIAMLNLDTKKDRIIELKFSGNAKNVTSFKLSNENIYAHNEIWDFPTTSLYCESKYAMTFLMQAKAGKEKYTEEYIASKPLNEIAMEYVKDAWLPLKEKKNIGLTKETMPENLKRWIETNATGIKTEEEFFNKLQARFDKKLTKKSLPSRLMLTIKNIVPAFIKEHSTKHQVELKVEEADISNLKSGDKITLPKHSMLVIKWEE